MDDAVDSQVDGDDLDAVYNAQREFLERELIPLAIPKFDPKTRTNGILQDTHTDNCYVELRDVRLQVIVKIGSIHLTPDDPIYGGGKWHVEVR